MAGIGKEILRRYDEFGILQVFDNGNKRTLMFGADDEQGCVLKQNPQVIQFDYIRAMLLVLLFKPQSQHSLILGLGTGALANALFHVDPDQHLNIVELRQAVIDVAYSHFYLPEDPRLQTVLADAGDYIQADVQRYDLVFSDLYNANGMDVQQGSHRFLSRCSDRLQDEGWLVLNFWQNHRRLDVVSQLKMQFRQVWSVSVGKDNWILLASNSEATLDKQEVKVRLKALNTSLGFSLSHIARSLSRLI